MRAQLEKQDGVARGMYARVYMKLGEILEREFLEEYVKKGRYAIVYSQGSGS